MAAHMKAVEEAEAAGHTGDRGAWKWKIRQRRTREISWFEESEALLMVSCRVLMFLCFAVCLLVPLLWCGVTWFFC